MDDLPRIRSVIADKAGWILHIDWSDGKKSSVDLGHLVQNSKHFQCFATEPEAFRKVYSVTFGSGIAWENGLDFSAAALKRLPDRSARDA